MVSSLPMPTPACKPHEHAAPHRPDSTMADATAISLAMSEKTYGHSSEQPDFSIEQVQLQFPLNHDLRTIRVANDHMILFMSTQMALIDLDNPSQVKTVALPTNETFKVGFIDPLGVHVIVQTQSLSCFYLHAPTYTQLKPLHKFRGITEIVSIEFPPPTQEMSTGDFLLATELAVYVGNIKTHTMTEVNKKDDKFLKQVWKLDQTLVGAVYSKSYTQVHVFSTSKHWTWDTFDTSLGEILRVFKTTPVEHELNGSQWMLGTLSDHLFVLIDQQPPHAVVSDHPEIQLSKLEQLDGVPVTLHQVCVLSHHLFCMASDAPTVYLVNTLSQGTSQKIGLPEVAKSTQYSITADTTKGTYWVYNRNLIYEIVVENELILVWHDYYKLGKYEEALACLPDEPANAAKRDMVHIRQGYDYLQKGGFGLDVGGEHTDDDNIQMANLQIKGIKILAELSELFEKVCLMLLNYRPETRVSSTRAAMLLRLLVEYLLVKFRIARDARNHIQMVVLSLLIVEQLLTTLSHTQNQTSRHELDEQFRQFMQQNFRYFDKDAIYQIISRLHFHDKLVYYADLIKDYEYIIHYYIDRNEWSAALALVAKVFFSRDHSNDIIYDSLSTLLLNYPQGTIDMWLKLQNAEDVAEPFDPIKVLPALLTYNRQSRLDSVGDNKAITYLSRLIYDKGVRNRTINNYYLMLLLAYSRDFEVVAKHLTKFLQLGVGPYDSQVVLRMCVAHQHFQAAVWVLIDLGLYDQALQVLIRHRLPKLGEFVLRKYDSNHQEEETIALTGVLLARANYANRKRLWLEYSRYLIDEVELDPVKEFVGIGDSDMDHLKKLNLVLRFLLELDSQMKEEGTVTLKDLLPLLPDLVIINDFRDEIVKSLNTYNSSINQLLLEMKELLSIAARLKEEIRDMSLVNTKGKLSLVIQPGEPCHLCQKLLLSTKSVVYFPNCHHGFHKQCVVRAYLDLGNYQFRKAFSQFKRHNALVNKDEMEKMLVKECFLCSDHNITTIDEPFDDDKGWEL